MPITAEREGSGAPECQRREIKIPRNHACRGFYFSRSIRKANASLSPIRAYLGNLIRCAHPFGAACGTLSRSTRLWVGSPQPLGVRGSLKNYPEVRLEISESGHGLLLSFLKVDFQPESQQVTDQVTDQVTTEVLRLLTVLRGPMSRLEIQSALGLKHLPHLRDAYLNPAIKEGLLEPTIPEKPQSRLQEYRLTSAGKTPLEKIKAKK